MRYLLFAAVLCVAVSPAGAQSIGRGQYIVENVGMCNDCHTPRDETGQFVLSKALQGAPIGSRPIHPMPWAEFAPPIAGLPAGFTPEQMVAFLQSGKRPNGTMPRPPMPPYRLSLEDAQAVTEWLQSMKR
jgi:cytochrome c553